MARTWRLDYLDGWVSEIFEQTDGTLSITVTSQYGAPVYMLSVAIDEAVGMAQRCAREQAAGLIIDPLLAA